MSDFAEVMLESRFQTTAAAGKCCNREDRKDLGGGVRGEDEVWRSVMN
jgi:hypothetical protein